MRKLIIGGGVSGLVCAIQSARAGHKVTVLEADNRIGKKIATSGNGRCNLDNVGVQTDCYNNSSIVKRVFNKMSFNDCMHFWHSIGINTYQDQHGRVYPITDNSHSVVDCLRYACECNKVDIICESKVVAVDKKNDVYKVKTFDGKEFSTDEVIVACGSNSQTKIAQHSSFIPSKYFTSLCPSLTPIIVKKPETVLNGIRSKCNAQLYSNNGDLVAQSQGEVLFRDYGLSGICIMDLSATIARRTISGKRDTYRIILDLLPELKEKEIVDQLNNRINSGYGKEQLFYGILHNKLAEVVMKRCNAGNILSDKISTKLGFEIKHFSFEVDKLCGYQFSQVTVGGIDEKYVDVNLRLPCGMYALGEILNVDGLCGGYNIHFATASALYYCLQRDGKIYE